jgi:thiol-disulfide isomerase/thioredoxin
MIQENIKTPSEKLKNVHYSNKKEFEQFLAYAHRIEPIKIYINEFISSRNWLKDFQPTKTFIEFMKTKHKQLKNGVRNDASQTSKGQADIISEYITLLIQIREHDSLNKTILNLLKNNKGKFNAFDIQHWLLVSDTSARNQLKRLLSDEEYEQYVRTQTHASIKTIQAIAKKRNGKCHTKTFKNAKSKLHLECAEGHQFHTTYDSVVYHNTWCPHCHIYVSETICRKFFERIFKRSFPKSYPEWLVNKLGNQMELDGYCKELGIAFEYQGIQHRRKAFGKNKEEIEKIKKEDKLKAKLCNQNGIILLQIPDEELVPYEKMQNHIIGQYEKLTNKKLKDIPTYEHKEFNIHENKHAKKFRDYVEQKGGTLLTPYLSAKKEVTILCEKGHQWTTTPDSVYRDNWCSVCSGNVKGTAGYFSEIGKKFGCELISEYINAKTPLWYRCKKEHEFKKDPYWLKRNQKSIEILCPQCIKDNYAKKFEDFVKRKRGMLLTPYKGRFKPVTIQCNNKHEWDTTPGAVYQGSWCPNCRKRKH